MGASGGGTPPVGSENTQGPSPSQRLIFNPAFSSGEQQEWDHRHAQFELAAKVNG